MKLCEQIITTSRALVGWSVVQIPPSCMWKRLWIRYWSQNCAWWLQKYGGTLWSTKGKRTLSTVCVLIWRNWRQSCITEQRGWHHDVLTTTSSIRTSSDWVSPPPPPPPPPPPLSLRESYSPSAVRQEESWRRIQVKEIKRGGDRIHHMAKSMWTLCFTVGSPHFFFHVTVWHLLINLLNVWKPDLWENSVCRKSFKGLPHISLFDPEWQNRTNAQM